MTMKVAIVGGTGFVGGYVVDELVRQGMTPRVLVRKGSEKHLKHPDHCEIICGDMDNLDAVEELVTGASAAIFSLGVLRETPANGVTFRKIQVDMPLRLIDACKTAGVGRMLLISANGAGPQGTEYQKTKWYAEQALAASGMDWRVIRPSVIFGYPHKRSEFATQLSREVIVPPLPAPLFYRGFNPGNAGLFQLSPVHVEDVAKACARLVLEENLPNRIVLAGGPEYLSWKEILKRVAAASGVNKTMIPVPAVGIATAARLLDHLESFPISRDQLTMLMDGNVCTSEDLVGLGITPRPFNLDNLAYLSKDHQKEASCSKKAA